MSTNTRTGIRCECGCNQSFRPNWMDFEHVHHSRPKMAIYRPHRDAFIAECVNAQALGQLTRSMARSSTLAKFRKRKQVWAMVYAMRKRLLPNTAKMEADRAAALFWLPMWLGELIYKEDFPLE